MAAPGPVTPATPIEPAAERDVIRVEEPAPEEERNREPDADALPGNLTPEETNVWPDAAAEQAFLAETRARGEPVTRAGAGDDEAADAERSAPQLAELVEQIPASTRELMEELFRARFVAVRRVKKRELKPETQS